MKNSLSVDLSLDDPILPSSSSKARDMLLGKSHAYISDLQFYQGFTILKLFLKNAIWILIILLWRAPMDQYLYISRLYIPMS